MTEGSTAGWLPLAIVAGLVGVIFLVDAWVPLDLAIAVLYVVVILLSVRFLGRGSIATLGILCIGLTLLGFGADETAAYSVAAVGRCVVSLVAIGVATLLSVRNRALAETTRDQASPPDQPHDAVAARDHDVIDTIPVQAWRANAGGSTELCNRQFLDYTGLALEDAKGWGWTGALHPDDTSSLLVVWREIVAASRPGETEARLRRFDGVYRWFLFRAAPLLDGSGAVVAWYGTNTDVDDMKWAEARLRRAETDWRAVIDTIPTHIWTCGPDGTGEYFNRRRLNYTGPGLDFTQCIHVDDQPAHNAAWWTAIRTGSAFQSEQRIRAADGTYRWFLSRAEPLRDEAGQILKWIGMNTDIDDLRRAEERIRHAESDLRDAVDTIPAHVWSCHPDGSSDYTNRRRLEYTGPDVDFYGIIHPDDRASHDEVWATTIRTGNAFELENRLRRFDGTYRWFLGRAEPQRDADGRIIKWFGTNTDIDDQKQAESALRRSEAYLADAQRLSRTGTLGWRADGCQTFWSDETYRIFGYDHSVEPSMDRILERIHSDDVAAFRQALGRVAREATDMSVELRLVNGDGEIKHLRILAHPMTQMSGETEFIGAVTDITTARRAEEALQRAQAELAHVTRVSTLGELTASIAHEINQPLAGIVTNGEACLRWLRRDVPDWNEAERAVERIVGDGMRAAEVVRRLRAFMHKGEPQLLPLDLNDIVEDSLPLVRQEISSHRVMLKLELSAGLPAVLGDRVQLQQVVINLIVNAIQAMADLTDRTRVLTISSRDDDAGRNESGKVLLAVRDSGPGIKPASRGHLFDAFYTTRPDGMGMGLTICRSIIEAHGGKIWAAADSVAGAAFEFTLPVHREALP